jgi:peptide/histidine transporter 3/4
MVKNIFGLLCIFYVFSNDVWESFNDASLVTGNECCERLAYYGIAKNLVTYLKIKLHQGNLEAARNVTTWTGTCYLTPLIGAILADSYWGKYWTIAVFSSVYFIVSKR